MEVIAANPGGKRARRRAANAEHAHAERRRPLGDGAAEGAGADHGERLSRELEQRFDRAAAATAVRSCARTSAGSWRAKASIRPSTCSAMLIAWLPLPLVSTRWSLATSLGVEIRSMPAPR